MSSSKSDITIAVVGGGLGGVCAAIALGRAGYTVHLFEQAPEFSEVGAGVGISPNSFRALAGISSEAKSAYEKVADMQEEGSVLFQVLNAEDSSHKFDLHTKGGPNSYVHRRSVLQTLVALLPSNVTVEFSTHISDVENIEATAERPAHVRVTIEPSQKHHHPDWPGTTRAVEVDAVIGCDGVKSVTRACIGSHDLDGATGKTQRYTGTYAYRGLLDAEEARKVVGESVMTATMWCAKDKHALIFPVEHNTVLNLVAFVSDRSKDENDRVWDGPWVRPVSMEEMLADFEHWDERPRKLLEIIKQPQRWALHECLPLDFWTQGRVTLLGDAAHASLPHNGAGAGQAIEDAYVLGELLRLPECTRETLSQFLLAYEAVRRPRASRQQVHSRESGEIYDFVSSMGNDWVQIAETVPRRFEWLWEHDLAQDVAQAKEQLKTKGLL